jgi:hypothetical protein
MPRYANLYARLVANTDDPENDQGCWPWTAQRDRWGYGRLNVYVPMLGDTVKIQAHLALFVWLEAAPSDMDEFWLAYLELRHSGLELDHECVVPSCIHPDHHSLVTPKENCELRDSRRLRVSTYA